MRAPCTCLEQKIKNKKGWLSIRMVVFGLTEDNYAAFSGFMREIKTHKNKQNKNLESGF